jgi:hypothetical protein
MPGKILGRIDRGMFSCSPVDGIEGRCRSKVVTEQVQYFVADVLQRKTQTSRWIPGAPVATDPADHYVKKSERSFPAAADR